MSDVNVQRTKDRNMYDEWEMGESAGRVRNAGMLKVAVSIIILTKSM